jgi:aspartate carbamoyltransferase catalytic subunit
LLGRKYPSDAKIAQGQSGQGAYSRLRDPLVDLLSIDSLTDEQIARILDRGEHWFSQNRAGASSEQLRGTIVFNLFYEDSTRTLMSFATAAHRLGASAITLPVEQSSVKKGESLKDTARTLNAMRPDALVMRHRDNGTAADVAEIMDAPVINAGDGTNEHPTQALLDAAALRSRFGRIEGLRVAICGDIRHSRVARSNAKLLSRLGADVRLAGPPSLLPDNLRGSGSIEDALDGADAVMMLRVQRERMEEDLGDLPGEYLARYGLTADRLAKAAPHAVVMHPGPMNRGVEIESAVADDPQRSLITLQVEFGVAVRMACLELLAGSA